MLVSNWSVEKRWLGVQSAGISMVIIQESNPYTNMLYTGCFEAQDMYMHA